MAEQVTTVKSSAPRASLRRGPLMTIRNELEDLFSNLWTDIGETWPLGRHAPAVDLSETDTTIEVQMDVPGLKPSDIDIQLSGTTLTVRGEKKEQREEKGRTFHRIERRSGAFSRSVTLPCEVKEDKIDAQYNDGVLTISLPKCDAARRHKIKVKIPTA